MIWDPTKRPLWCRCLAALLAAILAAVVRWQFLGLLGLRAAFLTFFPAVVLAALYGGITAGLLSTVASAVIAGYFWTEPIGQFVKNKPDLISIIVFLATGALISYVAEVAFRAQARADKAEQNEKLSIEREQAEERLSQQRKWFEVTLKSIGDGVLTTDIEGKITFLNPVATALVGRTVEEAAGLPVQSVFRIINEKTRAPGEDIVARVLEEGNIVALANHSALIRPDGCEVPIEDSAAPIKDARGNVSGVVLVFHDVTERRRAQEALRESERHYRSLFENMLNGFAYCKMLFEDDAPRDFIYLEVNRAFETLTGLKGVAGRKVSEVIPGIGESSPELLEICGRVARTGVPEKFESFVQALGQWFSVSVYAPFEDHFVAVFDVITERKRAEENAARLAAIVESSNDAIIGKTPEGEIVSWNRAAQTIFGYGAEEAIGRSISILSPSEDDYEFSSILEKIGRSEVIENLETLRRRKNGEIIDVSLSVSPIRDKSGTISGASIIARDISERKRMERERDITIELLKIINDNAGTADLVRAAAAFFQKQSGCEAVGIRLKEGDDFPYAEARGFSQEFVQRENSLCARDAFGNVLRDDSGKPYIECMCGKVISERVDSSEPFFSPGGSFWTNNTTELLSEVREARHHCNAAGYKSVALIPLNIGTERFGVLQLNDRRNEMFSSEIIAQWERLGGYLAVALARSRSEETMRESEERFRVMMDSIPQLAWLARADGDIFWYNRRWYEYTGATPAQMQGWGWQSVHDPDMLPDVLARWKDSLATGKAFDMVFPLRGSDGNFRQFLTRVEPVKDASGNVVKWCGTNTDITEGKLREEELRRSELKFKLLSETAGNLLASADPQGMVNELCRNVMAHLDCHCFFNFLVDEKVGRLHLNAWAGIAQEEARKIEWLEYGVAVCGCVAGSRERIIAEDIFNTPDVRTELVKTYGVQAYACHPLMVQGKLIGTLSFGTKTRKYFTADELALMKTVTDQVAVAMERIRLIEGLGKSRDELESRVRERTAELEKANEVVKDERKRLFDVLETLPAMICLLTSDYHVAFANRSFRERFNASQGGLCHDYCFNSSKPCEICETYRVLQTGQPQHWEVTAPDGSVIDAYDFPFTDVDGSRMILEMHFDITERRRAEAELRTMMDKLEQSNQALQDFGSIASHDLQEPLRKVISFGGMLKSKFEGSLGETGNDYLDRMLEATQRMQSLLKGLLEYSRVTTQAHPFSRVDLNKIVGEVLSDLEIRIEKTGAEVRVSKLPILEADPVQMRQVFQNLIGNALKFHKEEEQPLVGVSSAVVDGKLQIVVEDNGIGFEIQYADRIFAPFQRLHGKSSSYAGTGMGLAICKKIVERHGGSITAESAPGKGSTFIVSLPRNQGE